MYLFHVRDSHGAPPSARATTLSVDIYLYLQGNSRVFPLIRRMTITSREVYKMLCSERVKGHFHKYPAIKPDTLVTASVLKFKSIYMDIQIITFPMDKLSLVSYPYI